MVDFFANMASQVLQSKPEVQPLLPLRFAPWPGASAANGSTWPQEEIDATAQTEDPPLPPLLIAPDHPDVGAPLPTFARLRRTTEASAHPVSPDLPPGTQDTSHLEQEETHGENHAADSLPHTQPVTLKPIDGYETMGQEVHPMPRPAPQSAARMSDLPPSSTTLSGKRTARPHGPHTLIQENAIQTTQARTIAETQPSKTSKAAPTPAETVAPPPVVKPADQAPLTSPAAIISERRIELQQQAKVAATPLLDGSTAQTVPPLAQEEAGFMRRRRVESATPTKTETPRPPEPIVPVTVEGAGQPGPTLVQATPPVVSVSPRSKRHVAPAQQHSSQIVDEPSITPITDPARKEARPALRVDARVSAASDSTKPEPAPTVRVTIGRVVVRSSPAPERVTSQRAELPPPPLSLEEYLQGRQGGE